MEPKVRWVGCEIVTSPSFFSILLLFTVILTERNRSRNYGSYWPSIIKKRFFNKRPNGTREIKMKRSGMGKAIGYMGRQMYPQKDCDDTKVHVMALTGHEKTEEFAAWEVWSIWRLWSWKSCVSPWAPAMG